MRKILHTYQGGNLRATREKKNRVVTTEHLLVLKKIVATSGEAFFIRLAERENKMEHGMTLDHCDQKGFRNKTRYTSIKDVGNTPRLNKCKMLHHLTCLS